MPSTKKTKVTTPKKTTKNVAVSSGDSLKSQVTSLEQKVAVLHANLQLLTSILEQEFRTQMLQGPKQVAAKIKSAGLLEDT